MWRHTDEANQAPMLNFGSALSSRSDDRIWSISEIQMSPHRPWPRPTPPLNSTINKRALTAKENPANFSEGFILLDTGCLILDAGYWLIVVAKRKSHQRDGLPIVSLTPHALRLPHIDTNELQSISQAVRVRSLTNHYSLTLLDFPYILKKYRFALSPETASLEKGATQ